MTATTDVAIVGGGIVGLATAYALGRRFPDLRVTVLEKEARVAEHQTGRNSGVLHSGIYYKPGSLKAVNCREGKRAMEAFCAEEGIPFERCGKVIVAVEERELPVLQTIYERGQANGVVCERIGPERLAELEPHVRGIAAIHVPEAGIVDYRQVAERLAARVAEQGGAVVTGARVTALRPDGDAVVVASTAGAVRARFAVACAGLQADRVARLGGERPDLRIVPFRGEYYELKPQVEHLCRALIYPVPDPSFPFLGVHFTRMIGGGVECGPNAVLAFAREGYTNTTVNLRDLAGTLAYGGFRKLARRFWRTGWMEMRRSFSKRLFVEALQRLVPEVRAGDLVAAPAGVRAQAVRPDGTLVDDFYFEETARVVHVLNAPSPAATASLNIGRLIADRLAPRLS